jgi:hypothetical protein
MVAVHKFIETLCESLRDKWDHPISPSTFSNFLKACRRQKDPKTIAKEHTSNSTSLITVLEENLFQTKEYSLRRRMKRIVDSLKSECTKSESVLTVCTTEFYAAFQALSMVHLLSLNTQGIKGEDKQINLALYAKRQRADILLLQETNLTHCAVLPTLCMYHFLQNPTDRSASGTAIALHTQLLPHIVIHSHWVLVKGNLQTCHITICKEECQLINKYMQVSTSHATTVVQTLETHMKTLPSDRKVLIGGRRTSR